MNKKISKTNSFGGPSTPIWVWIIIFIIFLQIAKFAYRNDWFIEKKTYLTNTKNQNGLIN